MLKARVICLSGMCASTTAAVSVYCGLVWSAGVSRDRGISCVCVCVCVERWRQAEESHIRETAASRWITGSLPGNRRHTIHVCVSLSLCVCLCECV